MNRKPGLLAASTTLAVTLGGCAQIAPWPMTQARYCPPGYYLASDYLCHLQVTPPANSANVPPGQPSSYAPPSSFPAVAPEPPAPVGGDDDEVPQRAVSKPSETIPQAHVVETVATPASLPSASDGAPPLTDIEKSPPATWPSPDDTCVGAWRICHFY